MIQLSPAEFRKSSSFGPIQGYRLDLESGNQKFRQETDKYQVYSAGGRKSAQDLVDIFGRSVAGPDSGNVSAVFADIVGHFHRVENDADVKETEKDDSDDIQKVVQRHSLAELGAKGSS